ncbi:ParA family protein [Natronosporangium hydrolyticum]|uniref:ParA family protein n=1 Tax=Natronosporangium hydrolyticum TaxID=2811111 RepID=A0A895YIH1_9ACTN|nr:ParA family protein [Natronosporangium hydrolyticum]QSB13920.1 ParA family protein [Natronosporangium hydrolyticum]
MTTPEHGTSAIRQVLETNADRHGLHGARIHVTREVSGGWRIRVVHDGLSNLSEAVRRERLLAGLEHEATDVELLTLAEERWYGPPFAETEGALPTWPDAFGQQSAEPLLFASDLDQDLPRPAVVTFYSLKGGVGRTTALAATARILAGRGHRVLTIDMDFEAPGLPFLFGLPELETDGGALSLLLALEQGEEVDVREHLQRVDDAEELYCIHAGKLGIDYAQRLQLVEPEAWYRETPNPLHKLIDAAASSSIEPDFILLDSRTGISPISAPLLFDVADLAVVCFFPHPQAERGTELLVDSLLAARTRRSVDHLPIFPEPRFLVSPVPPGPSAATVQDRALSWIDRWLSAAQGRRESAVGPLRADELSHFVRYSPETAFADSLELSTINKETYGPVADWLEQLLPQMTAMALTKEVADKRTVLHELDFSAGTAEHHGSFFDDFVRTAVFDQAMDRRYPLVVGRKGTGKTAVFRWLLERAPGIRPVPVICSPALRAPYPWVLNAHGFAAIEPHLQEHAGGWSGFWACYAAMACYLSAPQADRVPPPTELGLSELIQYIGEEDLDELVVQRLLVQMLDTPNAGLLAARWLKAVDATLDNYQFLLFDGLDTGFGNDDSSRSRRTSAVTGLFTFLTDYEGTFQNLSFKILLRFDIWQDLHFQNKSHLLGRSVQLRWKDQADYFRTVLKQAARSDAFMTMLGAAGVNSDPDLWSHREVFQAWNILVGERMKGGKTTFTRNWVWNRLADGQGDHGPRALIQLFNKAVEWEKQENPRNPYDRSMIRPRALVPSLEEVSDAALAALLDEEFPELRVLVGALQTAGRTPLDPSDIGEIDESALEQLGLALEVGLIAVHEGTQEAVRRYRVPDLYRHALRMTRKGQA